MVGGAEPIYDWDTQLSVSNVYLARVIYFFGL